MGSRSSLSRDLDSADVDHWEMNYHEAAIFLEVNTEFLTTKLAYFWIYS